MRGREAQLAGRADVDRDGRVVRPLAPHHPFDQDGGGVRGERAGPGHQPIRGGALGISTAPSARHATQPMLCSPKWDSPRAAVSTPGRSASADCTATSAATSPRGGPTASGMCARS